MERILHSLRKSRLFQSFLGKIHLAMRLKLRELPFSIYIDPLRNTQELFSRSYDVEHEVTECLLTLLKQRKFSHFLDIGANVGFFSWLVLSRSPTTQCHLFEPDLNNIRLIQKTVRQIDKNIHINSCVVSDINGEKKFHADIITGKTGSISLVYGSQSYAENFFFQNRLVYNVRSVTLDFYTKSLNGTFLVKCDIEGAENLMVNGGADFIRRKRPIMIMEINRSNADTLPDLVASFGYIFYPISKSGYLDRDYLFVPKELDLSLHI